MRKVFDFKGQLNTGNVGEKLFTEYYEKLNPEKSTEDLAYDFTISGQKVELKTDTYRLTDSANFFMERYGCNKTFKSGGPWRTLEDKIEWFVYFYINDKIFYWFDPKTLCPFLDKYIQNKGYKEIRNRGWTAIGYTVPREECEHLLIRKDQF